MLGSERVHGSCFTFGEIKVSPIVRYERLWGDLATTQRYAGGIVWPYDHSVNLKLFYTRIQPDAPNMHGANQVNAQLQLYYF